MLTYGDMSCIELLLIAIGLSMDAFAVSICTGLTMKKVTAGKALAIGGYFGVFQAVMPVFGYFAATLFAGYIIAYDHWVAFGLLCFLGGKMIISSFKNDDYPDEETSLKAAVMLPLAVATSIDALAVGVSFAFLKVSILPSVILIGITTFLISILGVKIGNVFGIRYKSKAEAAGGVILILIGVKVVLEHLDIW